MSSVNNNVDRLDVVIFLSGRASLRPGYVGHTDMYIYNRLLTAKQTISDSSVRPPMVGRK